MRLFRTCLCGLALAGCREAAAPVESERSSADNSVIGNQAASIAPEDARQGCAAAATATFDWRDAVIYFALVDRFENGDVSNDHPSADPRVLAPANWHGGDWAGLERKVREGYFNALGVNVLWLSGVQDSADDIGLGVSPDTHYYTAYHGYWPRDLEQVEARLGSEAELRALVEAAHQRGLKVILDYAMNHVHVDSPVWQAHKSDGWFNPLETAGGPCVCGTAACSWDGPMSKACWFTDYLPDFDFNHPDARRFSVDNAVRWLERSGADGLRLDAVKHIELSWLDDLRARLNTEVEARTGEHVYLVGETYTGDRALLKSFVDPCTKLDGQFDFALRAMLGSTVLLRQGWMNDLARFMDDNDGFYGDGVMSTFIGNHDVPRSIHFAEDTSPWDNIWADGKNLAWENRPVQVEERSAYERLLVAFAFLFTQKGAPLIYYGDEVGLPGAGDPDNRRPLQAGAEIEGQRHLRQGLERLGRARAEHPALRRGARTTLQGGEHVWAYRMVSEGDALTVVLNRADDMQDVSGLAAGAYEDLLTGVPFSGPTITVPPRTALVLVAR